MQFSLPIIKSTDYIAFEKLLLTDEKKIEEAMEKAGLLFFEQVIEFLIRFGEQKEIILLLGKGNNAADALVCGRHLIKAGLKVLAVEFFEEGFSTLYKKKMEQFISARGETISLEQVTLMQNIVLIDGVFGSGFSGELSKDLKDRFSLINQLEKPVISLDAPSGVSGDKGAHPYSIKASITLYLDYPRLGFFLEDTPNFVGELLPIYLGVVSIEEIEKKIQGYLVQREDLFFPPLERKRHKYQAGAVVGFCGSKGMSGALNLAGLAALKVGAGIVKFVHFQNLPLTINELILFPLRFAKQVLKKAQVFMAGPGIRRTVLSKWILNFLLKIAKSPSVIDADGLYHLTSRFLQSHPYPLILTPHRKECVDLLKVQQSIPDEELFSLIEQFCEKNQLFFILKGVPTVVFAPGIPKLFFYGGSPGMATAGSGDVLTGMISGLIAQNRSILNAICLAVYLHQKAGEIAEKELTAYSITATSLIEKIPDAFFSSRPD
jgi:NAD(P)H-hydrate epimerase